MRSLECWQNAQTKRAQDLEAELHTRGCLQPLRVLFESHAVHIGAIVAAIIVPVVRVCHVHSIHRAQSVLIPFLMSSVCFFSPFGNTLICCRNTFTLIGLIWIRVK